MALARHQFTVTDEAGNIVPFANVEVRAEIPGLPLVQLYDDRDGISPIGNPIVADADGFVFFHCLGGAYQIRVWLGALDATRNYVAVGRAQESDTVIANNAERIVTAAGAVAVTADDADIILINKNVGAATTVNLPPSAARTKPVRIVDRKYDALTNNITLVPNGAETIMGGASYIIDSNGGGITLTPLKDGSGWI
ncbi:hypothetical protein RPMA_18290 [Tardiphaga alba]|uniref:Uncharacterized protein n=1 Tax=Tardiphaga alba TaxID=340268 RepID=A0ABX8A9Z0_9BRAD|nr:hypothetical protein [Tardiphaga alba]QUS40568.1 hypothetical protein RPMA_18290 [Tardiphaga alba]